jgi:hypothetical protein
MLTNKSFFCIILVLQLNDGVKDDASCKSPKHNW